MATDPRDILSEVRTARFNALVAELIPKIRRLGPELSEEALIETAERLADHRLASEGLGGFRAVILPRPRRGEGTVVDRR